jgi:DNA primase
VADLPSGVDPADLATSDPDRLLAAIDEAVPFLKFRVDRVLAAARLDTAEGRARAAEAALTVLREHPSDLVRDQYLMEVAGRCRVEPEQLRTMLREGPRTPVEGQPVPSRPRRDDDERAGPELEVLRHVVHDWAAVEHWIRYEELFERDLHALAFRALMAHPTVTEAIDAADPRVAELLARLATEEVDSEAFDAVVRLLTERARHEVNALVPRVAAEPERQHDVQWLTLCIDRLRDPAAAAEAAEQLVAWLGSTGEGGE